MRRSRVFKGKPALLFLLGAWLLVTSPALPQTSPVVDEKSFAAISRAAMERLVTAAERGDAASALILGRHHLRNGSGSKEHNSALSLLQRASEAGLEDATLLLADTYRSGTEAIPPNPRLAVPLYEKLAEVGNTPARRSLAAMLLAGQGINRNPARALDLLTAAANAGSIDARFSMATIYAKGEVVAGDGAKAAALYEVGLPDRLNPALTGLAELYRRGAVGLDPQLPLAVELYAVAAAAGDVGAALAKADMTLRGEGIAANPEQAIADLTALAEKSPQVLLTLGDYAVRGDAVPMNIEQALGYYEKARGQGVSAATLRLADLFRTGAGTLDRDSSRAYSFYSEAAAAGDTGAARRKAEMRARGEGVKADLVQATSWLEDLARSKGDISSLLLLGDLYLNGSLVPINAPKAIAYYQQAADTGSVAGLLKLAELYRSGNVVLPADPERAVKLYEQAVAANDNSARKALANLFWNGAAGVSPNPQRAASLLEAAIADGDASSAIVLGQLLARGAGDQPSDYEGTKRAFEVAGERGVTGAQARFALAILDGPLQTTHGNEGAALLKEAVKANVPGTLLDLARLQVAGKIPGDTARSAIALLEPAAVAGDISAIRYLLSLYRDGAGKALAPAHSKARDLLAKSVPLLGPDTARQERILLTAASAASATSLAAMLPDYTSLVTSSQVAILQRLATSYQNAYVYLLQTWLRDHGRYDGSINGILSASTVQALNQLCSDADADLICSRGLLARDATSVITNFIMRPEHLRPDA